jgi:hypothetical protein
VCPEDVGVSTEFCYITDSLLLYLYLLRIEMNYISKFGTELQNNPRIFKFVEN